MRTLRRLHLYLGCFFSPLLLFYVATGWYQTVTTNRTKTEGEAGDWLTRMTSVHVDQIYPVAEANGYSPRFFRWLVIAMSVGLILTLVLGIVLAFRLSKPRWPVWLALVLGLATPILMLWLGVKR